MTPPQQLMPDTVSIRVNHLHQATSEMPRYQSSHPFFEDPSTLLWLASAANEMKTTQSAMTQPLSKEFVSDRVVRVLGEDSKPIVKLEKSGLVSLAGIQIPQSFDSTGSCRSYTTANAKVRQLLPADSRVRVRITTTTGDSPIHKAILVLESPSLSSSSASTESSTISTVQGELLRRGFAKVKSSTTLSDNFPGFVEQWKSLEQAASENQVGPLYQTCSATDDDGSSFNTNGAPQFEPLEFTMQTDWKVDGGKRVRRVNPDYVVPNKAPPKNPGDTKGCSDFATYEDALSYYEYYFPFYGDVARLDRDKDGVPCPGLPHTKDMERYRMKIPAATKGT